MGKKLRNKRKKQQQQEKHDPVLHDRRRNKCDSQASNAERDEDKIEEKSANDFISRLPDDVLKHIISLLPLRDAVRTGFLSTRWRGVWQTGLETIEKDGTVGEICREIGHFLDLDYSQKLGQLTRGQEFSSILSLIEHSRRLRLNFGRSGFLLATIMPNGTLHLDFYSKKHESPINFDLLWTSEYYFRWARLAVHDDLYIPLMLSALKSIRCLHLIAVTNLTSQAVSSILSVLHCLESLIIKECHGLYSLRIDSRFVFSKLIIFNCLQLKSVEIKAYKLARFWFRGLLPSFSCGNLGLADAMLDFRGGPENDPFEYKHLDSLLSAVRFSRILTLCRWTFESMFRQRPRTACRPRSPTFEFPQLKELQWIDNEVNQHSIDVLFSFLKRCPFLQKLYINIDPTSYSTPRTRKYSNQVFEYCKRILYFLEVVQVEGVMKKRDKKLLTSRLLDVVSKETKIIVKSHENRIWKFEQVSLSPLSQPIWYPLLKERMKKHYKFVEVNEEEREKLCSYKHAHADL